jgi:CHAT domain-containing protein/tetratricopeptide (TPR) repeat protein
MPITAPNPNVLRSRIDKLQLGPKRPLSLGAAQEIIRVFLDETDCDAPMSAAATADPSHFADKPSDFTVAARIRFPVGQAEPLDRGLQLLDARAIFYESLGRLDMARFIRQRAVYLCETVCGPTAPELITPLVTLAELEIRMGDFTSGDSQLNKAIEVAQSLGPDRTFELASTLHDRGKALARMGLYQSAARALEKAIALIRGELPDDDENIAILEEDLAVVFLMAGQSDSAVPILRRIVDRMDAEEMAELPPVRQDGIASYLLVLKRFDEAKELSALALGRLRTQSGEWTPAYAHLLSNFGTILRLKGDWDEAEPAFTRAAHIRRTLLGPDHPAVGQSLVRLALTQAARGASSTAWGSIKEAVEISDRLIGDLSSLASSSDRLTFLAEMRNQTMVAVAIVSEFFPDRPDLLSEAYSLVLHRKALSVEALAIQRNALFSGRYPALSGKMQKLDSLRTQLIEATTAQVRTEDQAKHLTTIKRLRSERDELSSELARQIPEIRLEETLAAGNYQAVFAALPSGCRLVEFFLLHPPNFSAVLATSEPEFHPDRYVAFVFDWEHQESLSLIDIGPQSEIDGLISEFTSAITSEETSPSKIGAALMAKLGPALIGAPPRLFIATDGNLSLLPFDTLPFQGNSSVLIDHHEITFVGSGRDLIRFKQNVRASDLTAPVIFAGPDFDAKTDGEVDRTLSASPPRRTWMDQLDHFESLPGASAEGRALVSLVPRATLFTEENATATAFRALHRPEFLHLATHAFVLGPLKGSTGIDADTETDAMTASGVALAGANHWLSTRGTDNSMSGIVMAEAIATIDLRDTSLVVLSACDTGRGVVMPGEGVFGLRRAFRIAGARTVVMTLWAIPDEETAQFMTMFYVRLLAGQSKASALRDAKLTFRKQFQAPYFWAGFVCEGDPSMLKIQAEGLQL